MPFPRCSVARSCPTVCAPMDCSPQAPLSMGFPRVGCHFLLQGIFPSQQLNAHLLPWQVDSLPHVPLSTLASHIKQGPGITVSMFTLIPDAFKSGRSSRDFPLISLSCPGSVWNSTYIQLPPLPSCHPHHPPSLLPSGTVPQSVCHSLDPCEEHWH